MRNGPQTSKQNGPKRRFDNELIGLLKMRGPKARSAQIDWQHDPDVIAWCITHQEHWQRLVTTFGNNFVKSLVSERR